MFTVVLISLLLPMVNAQGPGAQCLCFQEYGHGQLSNPISMGHIKDGSGRLLVGEQRGVIWVFDSNGTRLEKPLLNMTDTDITLRSVAGLLNFAAHPDYVNNGLLYLHYTALLQGGYYQRVSEMSRSLDDPEIVDPDTERILLEVHQEQVNGGHQGGGLLFGADGYLYISYGDGHCCYDPLDHAQNKSTYHGSLLRIDVLSRTGNLPYGIPQDNPFLDDPEALPELYVYGLRNVYTASMDVGDKDTGEGRGRIFLGDVGDETYEEVNEVVAGGNYGWPLWEGPLCLQLDDCLDMGPVQSPLLYYNHSVGLCVILGGVYRGCANPGLDKWMLFLDYASGAVFGANEQPDGTWRDLLIPNCATCPEGLTNDFYPFVMGMGSDQSGEMYFGAMDFPSPIDIGGSVYKIIDPNNPGMPCTPFT